MFALKLLKFNYLLGPQTFSKLSYERMATPQLIRKMLRVPVSGMCRKAKFSLYQGKVHMTKVQTCFSEHKTNVKVSPNIFRKVFHSKILGCRIKTSVSSTAYKTIRKYGGFDNYISCMDPKVMKSPYGNYLQTLMLRKIQNPNMLVPYVLKSKQLKRIRSRDYLLRKIPRIIMPVHPDKYYNPNPFGERVQQMDDAQYEKHLELEKLSKKNQDLDSSHPLIKELNAKLEGKKNPQAEAIAEKAREDYLNNPRDKKARKKMYLDSLREEQEFMQKMKQEEFKKEEEEQDGEFDEQKQNQKFYNYLDKLEKIKKDAEQLDARENKRMSAKIKKQEQGAEGQEDPEGGKKGKKGKKEKKNKKQ